MLEPSAEVVSSACANGAPGTSAPKATEPPQQGRDWWALPRVHCWPATLDSCLFGTEFIGSLLCGTRSREPPAYPSGMRNGPCPQAADCLGKVRAGAIKMRGDVHGLQDHIRGHLTRMQRIRTHKRPSAGATVNQATEARSEAGRSCLEVQG